MTSTQPTRTHSTDWCFTINNPPSLGGTCYEHPKWDASKMCYMKYSLEKGKEGTIHWQGFWCLKGANGSPTPRNASPAHTLKCVQDLGNKQTIIATRMLLT